MPPKQNKQLPMEIVRAPEFKAVHVSGVTGGLSPEGGQIGFYIDVVDPAIDVKSGEMVPGRVVRTILFEARMSTELFCSISDWMARHAEQYQALGISGENDTDD
ncbi:MAG: hypothetical protein AB7S61_11310 [Methanoregulaceae archaeon]